MSATVTAKQQACLRSVSVAAKTQPHIFYASRFTVEAYKVHLHVAYSLSSSHSIFDNKPLQDLHCPEYLSAPHTSHITPQGVRVAHP